jgi:hypothetical protein
MAELPKDEISVSSAFLLNLYNSIRGGVIKMKKIVSPIDDVFENLLVGAFVISLILLIVMYLVRYL